MKPGRKDVRRQILIAGEELAQLKRFTWNMAEAFGLDLRIERYQGNRPIGFYDCDLDVLADVIDSALADEAEYPDQSAPEWAALKRLHERIKRLRE